MESTLYIRELQTEQAILAAFPVMKHLRTHLDENSYLELVKEAQQKEGYRLLALYRDDKIVAVTGFMPMITLYNGRFIWVCDLVTEPSERSKGYGEKLLSYVHQWSEDNGYKIVSLSSGLQRRTSFL